MDIDGKKLRVGFQDLTIELKDADFRTDNLTDCYGHYLQRENKIQINTNLEQHDLLNTVIHEILHACCYVGGLTTKSNPLSDEDKEEVVTNTLANQIHIVLRDNPWLLKFIQESLSKTKHKEK
jgi:Zn-dependent peptidase ImmA (M78 family)